MIFFPLNMLENLVSQEAVSDVITIHVDIEDGIYISGQDMDEPIFALGMSNEDPGYKKRVSKYPAGVTQDITLDLFMGWLDNADGSCLSLEFDSDSQVWEQAENSDSLDPFQRFIVEHYDDGEALVQGPDDIADCGNGLLRYLLIECSISEDATRLSDVYSRIERSVQHLQAVLGQLDRFQLD